VSVSDLKTIPLFLQVLLDGKEILDDPIVDNEHIFGSVPVGMRIHLRGFAMGGPAGVGYGAATLDNPFPDLSLQFRNSPHGTQTDNLVPVLNGKACRVISTVLQAL
jgi:hypothetical protein